MQMRKGPLIVFKTTGSRLLIFMLYNPIIFLNFVVGWGGGGCCCFLVCDMMKAAWIANLRRAGNELTMETAVSKVTLETGEHK